MTTPTTPAPVARVRVTQAEGVQAAVKRAMELASWRDHIQGSRIFLKINTLSFPLVPGTNTSPWVLEGVLQTIREALPDVRLQMGDSQIVGADNVRRAEKIWGYDRLAAKYGVEYVDLSRDPLEEVEVDGMHVRKLVFPRTLLETDCLVTLPVMKCHHLSTITASLKNQWGCLPTFRHNFHPVLHQVIVDINQALAPRFTVIDGTVCQEGKGPRTGDMRIADLVIASPDLVAADAAAARYMGFDPRQIGFLTNAEARGLGSIEGRMVGDDVGSEQFATPKSNLLGGIHKRLRASFLKPLLFDTPIVQVLAKGALVYNSLLWYPFVARPKAQKLIRESWYGPQFPYKG
ncbi:MAG TPA: DUF362 domain-containing protein [Thermoanaerobaculia bacterium]|jgi:uncharacterized protein (DUF362 family)|nr:DUF362 domain-containing protein [Thermoanaerobaculia bacterium]